MHRGGASFSLALGPHYSLLEEEIRADLLVNTEVFLAVIFYTMSILKRVYSTIESYSSLQLGWGAKKQLGER